MEVVITVLAFVVAILILVSLHEFGHYIVARLCGVKVVRFSVGFGTPFLKKKRDDTEWCLAPIPLGGYVKMVDTREGNVAEADIPYAFDKQHPAKRIAIVAAGPLTNLILAVLLFAFSFLFGVTEIKPVVGMVEPVSVAVKAGFQVGDTIVAVNNKPVRTWQDARTEIVFNLESAKVEVAVKTEQGKEAVRTIDIAGSSEADKVVQQQGHIGLSPFKITNRIGAVVPESAADRAGLKENDELLAVDGAASGGWADWVTVFRSSPGKALTVDYRRNGNILQTQLRPDSEELADGTLIGKVGLAAKPDEAWNKQISYSYMPSVTAAFQMAEEKTRSYIVMMVEFFGKLVTGQASLNHISGPLTIADVAGKTAAIGIQSYLEFLALVSVSLGVMNLLPVPVLDGGHLVYYTLEWIRGRPLSERIQMIGTRLGLMVMLMLMLVAFFNDINRLFG